MVPELFIGGLNHLFAGNDWARTRLKPFSGKIICLESGPFAMTLMIASDGYLRLAESSMPADVILSLPADMPLRILTGQADRHSLVADAKINGSAELADCLGFVFRHLEWHAEDDLAPVVGDIAAHRLVQGGQKLMGWQREKARNLAQNLVEYFTEEKRIIISRQTLAEFCRDVVVLDEELLRLEKRIAALAVQDQG